MLLCQPLLAQLTAGIIEQAACNLKTGFPSIAHGISAMCQQAKVSKQLKIKQNSDSGSPFLYLGVLQSLSRSVYLFSSSSRCFGIPNSCESSLGFVTGTESEFQFQQHLLDIVVLKIIIGIL